MQKRILISVVLSMLIILISLGVISYLSINESIKMSMERRLTLASTIGKYIDHLLEENLTRLYDISISGKIDFDDNNWEPEKRALRTAYDYSIFTDRIFLLDLHGNVVLSHPHKEDDRINMLSIPFVSRIIPGGKPIITDVYTLESIRRKVIFALVPLKNMDGKVIGTAVGEINPTHYIFTQLIKSIPSESDTTIELVDSHATIISSNIASRILTSSDHNKFLGNLIADKKSFVGKCHRCHAETNAGQDRTEDMMAFAPISMAPWGISIREPQKIVFSPTRHLRNGFLILSLISIVTALLLGIGMSKSIVRPVHKLILATHKIAEGDLSEQIAMGGKDEIGRLSSSFEVMRLRLSDSLEELRNYNTTLEERVNERTSQINASRSKVEMLLKKVISAQEEERKRIARGLHDQTMQSLSALLMKIDICKIYTAPPPPKRIDEMRNIVLSTLDEVHQIIQNLRPSVLDDFGLESAIMWLLDKHMTEKNIKFYLDIIGTERIRFNPNVETTLFRIIQEAVINISKHSGAKNVFVYLEHKKEALTVDIEDDGEGFDACSIFKKYEDERGLGLLGMRERAYLLDGKLQICSSAGGGTRVSLWIPMNLYGEKNV